MDDQNIVLDVIVVNNLVVDNLPFPQSEPLGVTFCQSLFGSNTRWLQTSYNGSFRGTYAGIGYVYDPALDIFYDPTPPEPVPDVVE
jgi:hypothetical protein